MSKRNKIKQKKLRAAVPQSPSISKVKEVFPKKPSRFAQLLKPHIAFVILAFIFGSSFIIITPPFQVPDEIAHFDRAFKLAELGTFQKIENNKSGDYLPSNIDSAFSMFSYLRWRSDNKVDKQKIFDALKIPLEKNKKQYHSHFLFPVSKNFQYCINDNRKNNVYNTSFLSDTHATDSTCMGWMAKTRATKKAIHSFLLEIV